MHFVSEWPEEAAISQRHASRSIYSNAVLAIREDFHYASGSVPSLLALDADIGADS